MHCFTGNVLRTVRSTRLNSMEATQSPLRNGPSFLPKTYPMVRGLPRPADSDFCDWISPVSHCRRQVPYPVNAGVDMNVTFFTATWHSTTSLAAALSEKRTRNPCVQFVVPLASCIVGWREEGQHRAASRQFDIAQREESIVCWNQHCRQTDMVRPSTGLYRHTRGCVEMRFLETVSDSPKPRGRLPAQDHRRDPFLG